MKTTDAPNQAGASGSSATGLLGRVGAELNKSDGTAAQLLWAAPFVALWVGVPAWVLYKFLKSDKKPKGINWPLVISIGLPAGYFVGSTYMRRKADQAREAEFKMKRAAEAAGESAP